MSGQYNDVRGDFLYKLPRDQRTPANADADRHFVVIFAPQPADSALFIYVLDHTGLQTLSNVFANVHSIAQTDINCPQLRTREIMTPPAYVRLWRSENEG